MELSFSIQYPKTSNPNSFTHFNKVINIKSALFNFNDILNIFKNYNHSASLFDDLQRKNVSWSGSTAIPIDIDNGLTIDECKKKLNKLNVSYILYPSKSHKKEKCRVKCDRFHIFIPVTVKDKYQYTNYVKWFINKLGGDKACSDPARFFSPNPNLKKSDIIISNGGSFDFNNIKNVETTKTRNINRKDVALNNKQLQNVEKFFGLLSKNFHKTISLSHVNETNSSINYFRNKNDVNPALFQLYNSRYISDKRETDMYDSIYSPKDIINTKTPNREKIISKIDGKVKDLIENLESLEDNENKHNLNFIVTNEGTGKSTAFLKNVRPGHMIVAKDKRRIKELISQYENEGHAHNLVQIHSNGDIIFTNVHSQRNQYFLTQGISRIKADKKAKLIAEKSVNEYTKFIKEMENAKMKKEIQALKNQLKNAGEKNKETISMKIFLQQNNTMTDIEKEATITFYDAQLRTIADLRNKKVFITTVQKLKTGAMWAKDIFSNWVVHMDEYLMEVFNPGKIHEYGSYPYKNLHKYAKNEIVNPKNGSLYVIGEAYNNMEFVIEHNDEKVLKWKDNNLKIIIYTTEEFPVTIHQHRNEAILFDLRHNIYEKNLNIINLQSLNSRSETFNSVPFKLKKEQRTHCVIELVKKHFGISDDMLIVDGVQHDHNTFNIQGSNSYIQKVSTSDKKESMAIILKHPHPAQIAKYYPFFISEYLEEKAKNIKLTFPKFIEDMDGANFISKNILTDIANQSIGRLGGYRHHENVDKIYLIINYSILQMLDLKYVTPNIFNYTTMLFRSELRKTHKDIWNFVEQSTVALGATEPEFEKYGEAIEHIRDLKLITDKKIITKEDKNTIKTIKSVISKLIGRRTFKLCYKTMKWLFNLLKNMGKIPINKRKKKVRQKFIFVNPLINFYKQFFFKHITNKNCKKKSADYYKWLIRKMKTEFGGLSGSLELRLC